MLPCANLDGTQVANVCYGSRKMNCIFPLGQLNNVKGTPSIAELMNSFLFSGHASCWFHRLFWTIYLVNLKCCNKLDNLCIVPVGHHITTRKALLTSARRLYVMHTVRRGRRKMLSNILVHPKLSPATKIRSTPSPLTYCS